MGHQFSKRSHENETLVKLKEIIGKKKLNHKKKEILKINDRRRVRGMNRGVLR